MTFVLRLTLREMRASWRRLAFFFVCVAVGVAAIVAVRSVVQRVRIALAGEARILTSADIVIQSRRPWTPAARELIERRLQWVGVDSVVEAVETATMVRPGDERKTVARMAEIRAVQRGFPLYGEVTLDEGRRFSHALLEDNGALVGPDLLSQLGVRVGQQLIIGDVAFTIRGLLLSEPGRRLGAFSLGPRVLLDYEDFQQTGLLAFGSRARFQMLVRVRERDVTLLLRQLRADLRDEYVTVRSYRGAESEMGEDLERAEDYLSLIGFVILVLGGIGVWSVVRVFMQQKIRSIAILKCVGAGTRQIVAAYVLQIVLLALGGSVLGVGIATVAIGSAPTDLLPQQLAHVSFGLTGSAVAQGIGIGVLVSLLFSLVPLLDIRHVKPLLLLRHAARAGAGLDWIRGAVFAAVLVALVVLAIWQAGSLRVGLYVSAGFAGATCALHASGLAVVRAVRPFGRAKWFPLRHAVVSLGRPGNQTRVILLAVGLGSFFILSVRLLQTNLLREITLEMRPDAPDMFLIDIQQDQVGEVRRLLEDRLDGRPFRTIPVLRARVTGVRGREVSLDSYEDVRGRGSLGREYVITYRDYLEENERLVDGRFWGSGRSNEAEVSIEESIRERFDIQIGDYVRFDVLGRNVVAHVTSVREVDWDDARSGGFMFVFRPGAFEGAPHGFIAVLQGPSDMVARGRLQHDIAVRFPNVSAIDVREILGIVRQVIGNVALAISIVGGVALFSGILILVGSVAMTKFQRLQEAAILKTLGASSKMIAVMLVVEYGGLGLLAGLIGSAGATVLSWAFSTYLLEIAWRPAPFENAAGVALTAIAVAAVGVAASLDVLRRRPLATLRAE